MPLKSSPVSSALYAEGLVTILLRAQHSWKLFYYNNDEFSNPEALTSAIVSELLGAAVGRVRTVTIGRHYVVNSICGLRAGSLKEVSVKKDQCMNS